MNASLALACLPIDVRQEADAWHRAFLGVSKPVETCLQSISKQFGVSLATSKRKYYEWKRSGRDRLSLVNRARLAHPSDSKPDPEAFKQWYISLAERHQRKSKPAHREFCRRWAAGEEIPGLDNSLSRTSLPSGCSYENLQRLLSDKFALATMRRGLGFAIAHHGPKIFTTRVGMLPGQYYMFDDLWHDNFVVFRGQIVRVLEFDALDVASGCKCAWGTKPRIRLADGTQEGLGERYMRMLLASLLANEGYYPAGCTLMAEHGTAAIRDRLEALLSDRTGGAITVQRSGITGEQQAILGLGRGQGKGNPRFKASLESLRNLIHNELASLPAQTGLDRDTRPEHSHGILCETSDILKAVAALAKTRPQVADLVKLPLLQYHAHFLPLISAIYDRLNRRTWHNLEGWTQSGHIAIEYRLSPDTDQWLSQSQFLALPQQTQHLLMSAITGTDALPPAHRSLGEVGRVPDQSLMRERPLSPWEVWQAGRPSLSRIPAYVVAEILGDDFAQERKSENGYFEFQDQELSPEVLRFDSRITDSEGHETELAPDTYLVFVNPFDLRQLFVHDARGRFLGIAPRSIKVNRSDVDAVNRAFGLRSKRLADQLHPVKARHLDTTIQAAERAAHNADVLAPYQAPRMSKEERQAGLSAAEDIMSGGASACPSELQRSGVPDISENQPSDEDSILAALSK